MSTIGIFFGNTIEGMVLHLVPQDDEGSLDVAGLMQKINNGNGCGKVQANPAYVIETRWYPSNTFTAVSAK